MSKEIDPKLALKFRQQIQKNIKAGAKTREEFRKGIPSTFTAQDGKKYSLTGVSNYAKTFQNENVKTKNPSFKSVAGSKKNTQVRNASRVYMMAEEREGGFTGKQQEVGRKDLQSRSRIGDIGTKIGKIEAHHTRMLQMYRPFFEGLSDADKSELAKFAFDSKYALGDDITNRAMLSEPFHDQIHKFMRDMGYQVSSKKIKAGYKYPGVPDLGNTLESRKNALTHFFKNVQEPIERKLNTIKWSQEEAIRPLTKKEMTYASSWLDDKLLKRELKLSKVEVGEVGGPLGGIRSTINVKNISRALAANAAYSFVNPRSIRAATNIIAEGPNKENIKEVGLGIRDDLIHTGVVKTLGAATGAKALAIGSTTAAVPLGVGLVGGMVLNSIVEGATGKNLKEIGELAEEKKRYRKSHGLTNKKSDRQNYRHSTSPKVTTEMLEEWRLQERSLPLNY